MLFGICSMPLLPPASDNPPTALCMCRTDECVVRATVLNESSSGENKVKLMGAIVGEMASNMFGGDFYANNMKGSFDRNLNDR